MEGQIAALGTVPRCPPGASWGVRAAEPGAAPAVVARTHGSGTRVALMAGDRGKRV